MIPVEQESNINFNFLETSFNFNEKRILSWLHAFQEVHNFAIENVDFIFCDDEYLLEVNKTHLNHDYYTDIITFPYQEDNHIMSDIFISIDRIKDNATTHQVSFEDELVRVMAHGLLHLIGYDDKTKDKKTEMRKQEEKAIALYHQH